MAGLGLCFHMLHDLASNQAGALPDSNGGEAAEVAGNQMTGGWGISRLQREEMLGAKGKRGPCPLHQPPLPALFPFVPTFPAGAMPGGMNLRQPSDT